MIWPPTDRPLRRTRIYGSGREFRGWGETKEEDNFDLNQQIESKSVERLLLYSFWGPLMITYGTTKDQISLGLAAAASVRSGYRVTRCDVFHHLTWSILAVIPHSWSSAAVWWSIYLGTERPLIRISMMEVPFDRRRLGFGVWLGRSDRLVGQVSPPRPLPTPPSR